MKVLSIDRFDGNFAICETEERKLFAIDIKELPKEAKQGDMIVISDEGEITVDAARTQARKKKIRGMEDKLWK